MRVNMAKLAATKLAKWMRHVRVRRMTHSAPARQQTGSVDGEDAASAMIPHRMWSP
jgi:hypothetical protein